MTEEELKQQLDEIQESLNETSVAQKLLKRIDELEQENKEIYENGQIEITKLCNEKTKYHSALEEIREILLISELPPADDDNIMTATELMIEVALKREEKLNKIKDRINEVLK